MIKAGSLAYSVFLLFLSAAFSSLLYMAFLHYQDSYAKLETYSRLSDNCQSGLHLALAETLIGLEKEIRPFEEDGVLRIKKRPWGCFKLIASQATLKHEQMRQSALVATENSDLDQLVLWMAPRNYALKVSGSNEIIGKLRLPKKGVKADRIGLRRFEGTELYQGEVLENQGFVTIPEDLKRYWQLYFKFYQEEDSVISLQQLGDSINHSFLKRTIHARSSGVVNLSEEHFAGNIVISSDLEIRVGPDVTLDQVILVAPKISIASGTNIRAHLVSNDTIYLEKGVKMKYPSSVLLLSERNKQSFFSMDSASLFEGLLLAEGVSDLYKSNEALVRLHKGSIFRGSLISTGAVELKSAIQGHLITKNLSLKTSGAYYEGVLLDAKLECYKGSSNLFVPNYTGAQKDNEHEEIIAWLH